MRLSGGPPGFGGGKNAHGTGFIGTSPRSRPGAPRSPQKTYARG
ncbi:hypothetical protein B4135_1954 [Caldibacillus debilis]|uniref:Uncharacterized protein n=1 Tax=Caldibacillus debilis TaxID=301148 RepID=A0A150M6M1_9BACI|nr:hypothetical protein B4135_1954 [Caldibacillus debilis]